MSQAMPERGNIFPALIQANKMSVSADIPLTRAAEAIMISQLPSGTMNGTILMSYPIKVRTHCKDHLLVSVGVTYQIEDTIFSDGHVGVKYIQQFHHVFSNMIRPNTRSDRVVQ